MSTNRPKNPAQRGDTIPDAKTDVSLHDTLPASAVVSNTPWSP